MTDLFKGRFFGMYDKNGKPLHEGDTVSFLYTKPESTDPRELVFCKIVYEPKWAMFCLEWPNGYRNKFPLNPEKYELLTS